MLKICLSFDYELFLGENSASYGEILFNPTHQIQRVLNKENVQGTFFVDVCSAIVHEKYNLTDFSEHFLKQIFSLYADGHDVQLHLHPSWYKAHLNQDKLELTIQGYKLHDYGFNNNSISALSIISEGVDYLNKNLQELDSGYKCIAFRAGGFAIQPEREILTALLNKGVRIDSSVVPFMKNNNTVNGFDFSMVPKKINWWINPVKGINCSVDSADDAIYEVPILTAKPRLLEYIGLSSDKLRLPSAQLLGTYAKDTNNKKTNRISGIYKKFFDYRYVSLDTRYYERIVDDLNYMFKKHNLGTQDGYVCLICHPKLADEYRVDNIHKLIKEILKDKSKFKIVTMRQIYDEIIVQK